MLTAPSGPTSPGFAVPGYRHEATARRLPAGKAVPGRNLHDTAGKRRDSHCTGGEAASVRTPRAEGRYPEAAREATSLPHRNRPSPGRA